MTKKKAIKTIMAVTHYGNRSWANKLFDYVKKQMVENSSNVDICYRTLCMIYNTTMSEQNPKNAIAGLRSWLMGKRFRGRYGKDIGGKLLADVEVSE